MTEERRPILCRCASKMKFFGLIFLTTCTCVLDCSTATHEGSDASPNDNMLIKHSLALNRSNSLDSTFFIKQLFHKYGRDGFMTLEGFEHLLESIGLGRLVVLDEGSLSSQHQHNHEHHHTGESDHSHHAGESDVKMPSNVSVHKLTTASEATNLTTNFDTAHSVAESNSSKKAENSATGLYDALIHNSVDHLNTTDGLHSAVDGVNTQAKTKCLTVTEIYETFKINLSDGVLSSEQFSLICPAIIYELDQQSCNGFQDDLNLEEDDVGNSGMVWVYGAASVIVISLSGLLVVAVIPIMHGAFYQMLLQFLVSLAVGSLTGDALLHLLPHALASDGTHGDHHHHQHQQHNDHQHSQHEESRAGGHSDVMVWKGLVAVVGVLLFFMAERMLTLVSTRRKRHSESQTPVQGKIVQEDVEMSKAVGEKLCKHKYNSYGYCYGEVTMDMLQGLNDAPCEDRDHHNCLEKPAVADHGSKDSLKNPVVTCGGGEDVKIVKIVCPNNGEGDHFEVATRDPTENNGVIISEHEHRHHGHSHTHTHTVPASISAVAWMVIMGDGLHNFSDGLAIGAAFANGLTGGLSTSLAVFCHELPHELGDFAILLKSGMTAKQAIMYNGLSSVLCFLGMLLGVALGNVASVSSWIFAGAAGMFLYIALVDMIPELNSTPTVSTAHDSDKVKLGVQFLGMVIGVTIMLLIALYEHDLQSIISQ